MKMRMPPLKIRWKLIATLSVPLLVLAFVVGAEVRDRRAEARESERTRELIEVVQLAARVRTKVQVDLALTALPPSPERARRTTRSRAAALADVRRLRSALDRLDAARFGPDVEESATRIANALPTYEASALRPRPDRGVVDELAAGVVELGYDAGRSIEGDAELARRMLGYAALLEFWDRHADLLVTITGAANGKPLPQETAERIAADRVQADFARQLFVSTVSQADSSGLELLLQDGAAIEADARIRSAERTRFDEVLTFGADEFFPPMEEKLDLLSAYVDRIGDDLSGLASRKSAAASSAATWFVGIAIGATILALAFALLLLLSMGRRLHRLVTGAQDMAERQLPAMVESLRHAGGSASVLREPVLLEDLGDDEIGELGEAFNAVQAAFVAVASDQAELLRKGISDIYVKLARRNQSLVERQIALLDRLEAIEKDPDILENLFRLDHLATRIRRNAESLLVLAGTEPARKWSAPVTLAELLRAATAEVEDYSRIHVLHNDDSGDVAVPGSAALHLTHLFAELIENAVQFSPPGTVIEVLSRKRGDSYVVYVTDSGMGMTDEQLAEANRLLSSPPEAGLDLSRTLGLYVVGRLAARYGAPVRLARSPYDGIVASVTLPDDLVTPPSEPADDPAHEAAATNGSGDPGSPLGALPLRRPAHEQPLRPPAEPVAAAAAEPSANGDQPVRAEPPALPRRVEPSPPAEAAGGDRSVGLAPSPLSPEERRRQLSRFRKGLEQGRQHMGGDGSHTVGEPPPSDGTPPPSDGAAAPEEPR
jgi:signal transduction histidine kinase